MLFSRNFALLGQVAFVLSNDIANRPPSWIDPGGLPPFLTNNPLPDGYPWGSHNVFNTNPYRHSPSTGVTRQYEWNISRERMAPDGYEKEMLLVNSQFPGPLVEANWGDLLEITVHNNIWNPPEGTAIHWHGFLQHGTPWMDGTPGLTQCPIPPGESYTYTFRAELFGTAWWHSHYSSQYADGLFGPIVIYGPNQLSYDIDLGPILLSDYFYPGYVSISESLLTPRPNLPPATVVSDNNFINGMNLDNCSNTTEETASCSSANSTATFRFEKGKIHKLRLINTGGDGAQQFSIDNHIMTIVANDFVPVQPYEMKIVTLGIGQRTDVLVNATEDSNTTHWIRSNITCSTSRNPNALAILYYGDIDSFGDELPTSQPWPNPNPGCSNDPLEITEPSYPISVTDPSPASTTIFNITLAQNESDVYLWYLNNISFRSDFSNPTVLSSNPLNLTDNPDLNTVVLPANTSSYRAIVYNNSPSPHPLHLHGHNIYILAVSPGPGPWDGSIIRPSNPQRRDVQQIPPNGGYVVWQADADNPGAWGFHCHMVFHSGLGLFMQFVEGGGTRLEEVQSRIPEEVQQGCQRWRAFEQTGQVQIIDSGQ